MNGEQTNIRGYYALPAMLERNIVIDLFGQLDEWLSLWSAKPATPVRIGYCPRGSFNKDFSTRTFIIKSLWQIGRDLYRRFNSVTGVQAWLKITRRRVRVPLNHIMVYHFRNKKKMMITLKNIIIINCAWLKIIFFNILRVILFLEAPN